VKKLKVNGFGMKPQTFNMGQIKSEVMLLRRCGWLNSNRVVLHVFQHLIAIEHISLKHLIWQTCMDSHPLSYLHFVFYFQSPTSKSAVSQTLVYSHEQISNSVS
jgi:hypothetical protein